MGPAPVAEIGYDISSRIVNVAFSIAMNVHFFTGDLLVPNIKPVPHITQVEVAGSLGIIALEILINKGREPQRVSCIRGCCFPNMVLKLAGLGDAADVLV